MPRKKKIEKRNLAEIGRELQKEQKEQNIESVSGFEVNEPVQYYDEGWRYGRIRELPIKGINRGRARVENPVTLKKVWVDGTGLLKYLK